MQARKSSLIYRETLLTVFACPRVSNYRKRSVRYCRGAFAHKETQLTHFSFRRERQLQLAARHTAQFTGRRVLKTSVMQGIVVCYAKIIPRHVPTQKIRYKSFG
jgi:hypothetical protein